MTSNRGSTVPTQRWTEYDNSKMCCVGCIREIHIHVYVQYMYTYMYIYTYIHVHVHVY